MSKILIVDDEKHIVELIKYNLEAEGYQTIEAYSGLEAIKLAEKEMPDLILLDLMLPEISGIQICKLLRKNNKNKNTPIIMVTAKDTEYDLIEGFESGADDYIKKPFSIKELLLRVKAIIKRTSDTKDEEIIELGNLKIDFLNYNVYKNNEKVDLTLKEFNLLKLLLQNRGKVLTRDELLDKVWGYEYVGESRTVDVHIRHLRKKIEGDEKEQKQKYIETIRGVGYRME